MEFESPEQLHGAAQALAGVAAGAVDDSKAALGRANAWKDRAARIRTAACHMLPVNQHAPFTDLDDAGQALTAAAEQVVHAVTTAASAAGAGLVVANKHVALQAAGAAGDWYQKPVKGHRALKVAGSRLPDRQRGGLDNDAELTFNKDPGWSEKVRKGTSRAVRLFRNSTYRAIQKYLALDGDVDDDYMEIRERRGEPARREHILYEHVLLIDQAMEASRTERPIQVWRGTNGPQMFGDQWGPDMTGTKVHVKTFMSTSVVPKVASSFGFAESAGDVLVRINVPAGTGAVQLDGMPSRQRHTAEAEILLERDMDLEVVSDRVEEIPGKPPPPQWVRGDGPNGGHYEQPGPVTARVITVNATPPPRDDD